MPGAIASKACSANMATSGASACSSCRMRFGASAARSWLNLKDAVTGDSDKQIVEEVENGEDYIKGKYETALKDDKLSPEARAIVQEVYGSVQRGHERARQLKFSMQGTD
jgi:uncharacterized protein (TIGR02284 family)